jgi:hypothetical protein
MRGVWTGLAIVCLGSGCFKDRSPEALIDRAEVERILATLSADSMGGRRTFTPGIEMAAAFIEQEFLSLELGKFDDLQGYRQRFHMYSLTPESHRVVLNGREVSTDRYFFSVNLAEIRWATGDDVEVVTVGPDDNAMQTFASIRGSEGDLLVLMNERHRGFFDRLRSFMSESRRTMELGSGGNVVFVLTNPARVNSYDIALTNAVSESGLTNVVGMIPGRRRDEIVLFSAHYDHIGIRPAVDGDSVANGANDNATGTTAVMQLAKYFKAQGRPERTLVFVAFTAEEMGGFGSEYFARQLDPEQIVAMFNIEMIGKPAKDRPNAAWITGYERSDFGTILARSMEGTEFSFYADPQPDQNLFYRSDNATLARLGVPAHTISTTTLEGEEDYHKVSDEIETLDLDLMTTTIRAIARAATSIVSGAATPTRIDTSQLQ